eukprot:COSAG03_NODE_10_length_23829_cov_21.731395_8_plen_582_part_00
MEGIDVSRLSVAECLALAEQQETDVEKGGASDPVEDFLGRIAEDAAELTQILGEAALDLGLAQIETAKQPLRELSRHLGAAAGLAGATIKEDLLESLVGGLGDQEPAARDGWEKFFKEIFEQTPVSAVTTRQVSAAASDLQAAIEIHRAAQTANVLEKAQEHEDLITECAREYAALDKTAKPVGKKAATLKQFDEDAELERLRRVYEEIEEMLSTLEECVEIQKALSKTQTSGGHHERCQQWVKKAREKHLGAADTAGKATDETVQETLEKNAAVEKQVKIALARTVAEHCSSMNTEHSVSKKDASLKPGDFSSLKTLKLNEFDDLNPVSKRKMVNCVMTSLLRDPVSHAAILPALAVFFASNVSVHRKIRCPTVRLLTQIKLTSKWGMGNSLRVAGPATYKQAVLSLGNLYQALQTDCEDDILSGTRNWNVLFQPESEECKLYNLEGNKGDGGSYLEAWSFTTQWQATTQIEMHRMRIYESYRLLYDLKLEEALAKITELVETGIEYGSEVTWELTGKLWIKLICALHPDLETSLRLAKLDEIKVKDAADNCIGLLPDLISTVGSQWTQSGRRFQIHDSE